MRAITVRQPWAWAIIHGGKDVENRSRNIAGAYRGPVAIHAGLGLSGEAWADQQFRSIAFTSLRVEADVWASPRGAIIGVVDLANVHNHERSRPNSPRRLIPEFCSAWALPDHHHLILRNPRPLAAPIPYKGALGLWTLPDDVLAGVR